MSSRLYVVESALSVNFSEIYLSGFWKGMVSTLINTEFLHEWTILTRRNPVMQRILIKRTGSHAKEFERNFKVYVTF